MSSKEAGFSTSAGTRLFKSSVVRLESGGEVDAEWTDVNGWVDEDGWVDANPASGAGDA